MTVARRYADLRADRRGATIVEFALLAPIFLSMLFAIVEGTRFLWIKQSLKEVAFSTARCTSVSTDCATPATRIAYAVARANAYGQRLATSGVAVTSNTTCNASGGMVRVTISTRFISPVVGLLPGIPPDVTGTGCYPLL